VARSKPLTQSEIVLVGDIVRAVGERQAAKLLDVARATLRRARTGAPIHQATSILLGLRLAEIKRDLLESVR
jgi:hypothetical protein